MPDQKPTLEYGRLDQPRKWRPVETVIGTTFAAFGFGSLTASAMWLHGLILYGSVMGTVAETALFGIALSMCRLALALGGMDISQGI